MCDCIVCARVQSTAVRKAAREVPKDGVNGVVYIKANTVSEFSIELSHVLRFRHRTFDVEEAARLKLMSGSGKEAEADPSREPLASWEPLSEALRTAAVEFR